MVVMILAAADEKTPTFDVTKHVTNYDKTIDVAVTTDCAPFSFTDKNGNPTGFDVELVYKIGEILHVNMNVVIVPWSDAFEGVKNGMYDLVTDTAFSSERAKVVELTTPFLEKNHVLVSNNKKYLTMATVKNLKIAAQKGDVLTEMFFEPMHMIDRIYWTESVEEAVLVVDSGKADVIIVPEFMAKQIISDNNLKNLYIGNEVVYTALSAWSCKKGDTELVEDLNQSLGMLAENGDLAAIKNKWMVTYNQKSNVQRFFGDFGIPLLLGIFILGIVLTVLFMVNDARTMQELQAQEKLYKEKLQLDELTGLYTKSMARELIDVSVKYEESPSVFLVFNLDGLKSINDTLGHEAGDSAIKNFAVALRSFFGANTILARMSGDEFIGYAKFDGDEDSLRKKLDDFMANLKNFTTGGVILRCCVGAVIVGEDNKNFASLFKQGDTAMYLAKTNGKNQVVIYKKSMEHELLNSSRKKLQKVTVDSDFSIVDKAGLGYTDVFTWMLDNRVMANPDTLLMSNEKDKIVFIDAESMEVTRCVGLDGKPIENQKGIAVGKTCYEGLFGADHPCKDCVISRCNHNSFILHTVHSTEDNQDYVVRARLVKIDGKEYLVELFKAVSSESEMNHEYETATACQNLITACSYLDINPMLDHERYFREQIRIISQFFGAEEGYILRMDADMETATYNIPEERTPYFRVDMSEYAREKWGDMVDKNILAYIPDVEGLKNTEPNAYAFFSIDNIRNCIIAPVWDDDKVYGYMCLRNMTRNIKELGALGPLAANFKKTLQALSSREESMNRRYYDTMTGYLNFEGFRRQMDTLNLYKAGRKYALCSWDIRRFKYLNDAYGYDVGDKILQEVADLFARRLEDNEYLCRVNADRFCALCEYDNNEELKERLNDVGDYVTDYFNLNYNGRCLVELSIGIYPIGDFEEATIDEMLNMAMIAEKNAKQFGGNTVSLYDENLRNASKKEMKLQAEMEEALETREFKVFLQPQVYIGNDPETAGILRAEALCRWIRDGKMYATPGEFIPVFEHNGMISALDYYMLESVCQLIDEYHKKEKRKTCIAVNVSRVTFLKADFISNFDRILSKYDIKEGELELEFTEGVAVTDFERFYEVIEEVKKRGMVCAMDDFGSDYSNLNVLQRLPLDVLKLDKKFFDYTETGKRGDAIVGNTIKMARDLEMTTIAEGIESLEQVEALKKVSCDYIQGFVYARPMPAEDYLDWVNSHAEV